MPAAGWSVLSQAVSNVRAESVTPPATVPNCTTLPDAFVHVAVPSTRARMLFVRT